MPAKSLNARRIAVLGRGRHRDPESRGLYLQVGPTGRKSWLLRFEIGGRERFMGLGSLDDFTLKEARERARRARQQIADGVDPIEAKRAVAAARRSEAARAITFADAAAQYYEQHERKWKNRKHAAQFLSTLAAYALPKIGKLSVADVDTGQVLRVIEPIWPDKTETANRVRGRIEAVLDWATVRGYRTGDNPARWRGHLDNVLPARAQIQRSGHHAALPYADVPEFVAALGQREGVAARALEFTILTAARTGEVIGATWGEIDIGAKTWTIPGSRMKASKEHRVPLSDRAVAILRALPTERGSDHVFIGGRAGAAMSNMAMAAVLKRMGRGDVTVHGFRSTFMDWAHEQTAYAKVVIDMALAHAVGDKVEAAYRRGDLFAKRTRLMADWAKFCSIVTAAADVVPIRAGA